MAKTEKTPNKDRTGQILMVESESFIKEVSEEVKRDKLFKLLNKFKWPLFSMLILLVGAVGGYEYYKFDKNVRAQKMEIFWCLRSKV